MTTFTLQDLTPTKTEQATQLMEGNGMNAPTQINSMEVTQEEDEAMQALTEKQQEQLNAHELAHKMLQTIEAMPHNAPEPQHTPTVQELAQQLTQTFSQLITAISQLQQPNESLIQTVDTVLENADWFTEKVANKIDSVVEDRDFDYEIESAVESHFSNSFSLDDHVDISSEVESAVENQIDDVVERILQEKLQNLRITFD
jgi:hypothetical protein